MFSHLMFYHPQDLIPFSELNCLMESYNCCFSDSDVSEGYIILNTQQQGQVLHLQIYFKVEVEEE